VKRLHCRSWNCDLCRGIRRRQLMARAVNGQPFSFITLTCNPKVGNDPEERLKLLSHAWRVIVQRLRREPDTKEAEYLAIVEATEAGEPHLHILFRGPYIKQSKLSDWMSGLINAPICDVRRVRHFAKAATYVAKYLTKKNHQFGASKRYWASKHYAIDDGEEWVNPTGDDGRWQVLREGMLEFFTRRTNAGHFIRKFADEIWVITGVTDREL